MKPTDEQVRAFLEKEFAQLDKEMETTLSQLRRIVRMKIAIGSVAGAIISGATHAAIAGDTPWAIIQAAVGLFLIIGVMR